MDVVLGQGVENEEKEGEPQSQLPVGNLLGETQNFHGAPAQRVGRTLAPITAPCCLKALNALAGDHSSL